MGRYIYLKYIYIIYITPPGKIVFRDFGPNPGAFSPKKPGEEGTGGEIPLGRVKEVLRQDLGVKLGSPTVQSGVLRVRLAKSDISQLLLILCPFTPSSAQPRGCRTAGGGGSLSPAPSHQGSGGSGNPGQVGKGTLCCSFRGSCTFTPLFLLSMGMPREVDSPARSCPSPLLTSSLFLGQTFLKSAECGIASL